MELVRALATLVEPPSADRRALEHALGLAAPPSAEEHTDLFVLQLPPYASIYLGEEGMIGGDARDRVAGFWRALRLLPPAEPDHLTALLGLYATVGELAETETEPARRVLAERAGAALFWEHLASWLPVYLLRVGELGAGPHRRWAALLGAVLAADAERWGPPDSIPAHLRESTALVDEDLDRERIVRAVLSPVRSGLVLTRADLGRAARDLGLGLRLGERAFVVRTLIDQDARSVVRWLAGEARRQAGGHRGLAAPLQPLVRLWRERAESSACRLLRLVGDRTA
ncbi:MAG TPA: molecular chaperone TorD family protein [Candidatus Dormibacteraeota bacterium]